MEIQQIVERSLSTNLIEIGSKKYFVAGQHQFKSLWTRDFCFSVTGLLAAGYTTAVKDQLQLILSNTTEDGKVPLVIDSMNPLLRVALTSIGSFFRIPVSLAITENLKPFYKVNNKYPVFDSGLLLLRAILDYSATTQDTEFFLKNEKILVAIYNSYEKFLKDGLLHQGAYSDWKDSAKREGAVFLSNLLYAQLTEELSLFSQFHFTGNKAPFLRKAVQSAFFDATSGLYRAESTKDIFSLEDQLLILRWNWLKGDSKKNLWECIKNHPLWRSFDGPFITTFPNFTSKDLIWHVKFAGLKHYHDSMTWSWIVGLAFKVSLMHNDTTETKKILAYSDRMFTKHAWVAEIYHPRSAQPYRSWLYRSESPFLWGAASYAEALDFLNRLKSILGLS